MYAGDEAHDDDATSGVLDPLAGAIRDALAGAIRDARAQRESWPAPTADEPELDELEEWEGEGGCEATDGCWVEPDGRCAHGHPSWLLRLGLI